MYNSSLYVLSSRNVTTQKFKYELEKAKSCAS